MSRQPVSMRQATIGDVPFLVELWSGMLRRADRQEQVHDLELIVKEAAESPEQRLLVAEYDGQPAGAVLLRVTPMTPLNLEPTVQALAAHVTLSFRGKGIGSALMEAAVLWAEDLGHRPHHDGRAGVLAQRQPVPGPALAGAAGGVPRLLDAAGPRQAGRAPADQCPDHRDGRPAAATSARCWLRGARSSSAPAERPASPDCPRTSVPSPVRRHRLVGTHRLSVRGLE